MSCHNPRAVQMERETQGFPVTAIREIKILKALKHENIVDLREIVVFNESADGENFKGVNGFNHGDVFMVFEYADYDLYGLLKSSGVMLQEAHVRSYMKQLLDGVFFLHKNSILHRDIKSANILITRGNVLKIADWGLARFYNKNIPRMSNPVVTLWYRCPELLCGVRKYGPEVDMWSVGCIFGEMKMRQPILAAKENTESELKQMELLWQECGTNMNPELLKKYQAYPHWDKFKFTKTSQKLIAQRFEGESKWDTDSLNLLEQFLDWDPETRITAGAALDHDYFYSKQKVVPANKLPVFDNVECARQTDVVKKNREDYDRAVEKQRREERVKRDAAAAAANGGRTESTLKRSRFGNISQTETKYKVVRRDPNAAAATATATTSSAATATAIKVDHGGGGVNSDVPPAAAATDTKAGKATKIEAISVAGREAGVGAAGRASQSLTVPSLTSRAKQ